MIQNNSKRGFPYLTTSQAAEKMGIGERAVSYRCRAGHISHVKLGSEEGRGGAVYLIHLEDVQRWVEKHGIGRHKVAFRRKRRGKRKTRAPV